MSDACGQECPEGSEWRSIEGSIGPVWGCWPTEERAQDAVNDVVRALREIDEARRRERNIAFRNLRRLVLLDS